MQIENISRLSVGETAVILVASEKFAIQRRNDACFWIEIRDQSDKLVVAFEYPADYVQLLSEFAQFKDYLFSNRAP